MSITLSPPQIVSLQPEKQAGVITLILDNSMSGYSGSVEDWNWNWVSNFWLWPTLLHLHLERFPQSWNRRFLQELFYGSDPFLPNRPCLEKIYVRGSIFTSLADEDLFWKSSNVPKRVQLTIIEEANNQVFGISEESGWKIVTACGGKYYYKDVHPKVLAFLSRVSIL